MTSRPLQSGRASPGPAAETQEGSVDPHLGCVVRPQLLLPLTCVEIVMLRV